MDEPSANGSVVKVTDMSTCLGGPLGCEVTNLYLRIGLSPDIQKVMVSVEEGELDGEGGTVVVGISVVVFVGVGE